MARTRTANDHIFAHPQSRNLYIRLRDDRGRRFVKSLRTTDRAQAVVTALPMIAEHKARLLAARPCIELAWCHAYAPGLHDVEGGKVYATDRELHYLDSAGVKIRTAPNGAQEARIVNLQHRLGVPYAPSALVPITSAANAAPGRPSPPVIDGDDALLELYIKQKNVIGHRATEARTMWHLFKTIAAGKPLAKCTRDEGRAVVAALGNVKSTTARRKMVPLVSLVNLAIAEGKLTFNPFVGVVADKKDGERRVPFDDADMALMRANIGKLDKADALLLRLLATTGMRRGEAFAIDAEQVEGCRFVMVGTKTEASLRRVPLPNDVLPYLPAKITGPLFTGGREAATKRISAFLRAIGIAGMDKKAPMHSFRHRVKDRLRFAGCPLDVQYELLGHEHKTVASGYGRGQPVPVLKYWLDKVGL